MAEAHQIAELVQLMGAKEQKRRRVASIYLVFMVLLGVSITVWSGIVGAHLKAKEAQLQQTEASLKASNDLYLGMKAARAGHWQEAVTHYQKALDTDPTNDDAMAYMGYALYRSHQPQQAVTILERDVAKHKDSFYGHYNLALAYWDAGQQDAALAEVQKLVQIDPGSRKTIREDPQFKPFKSAAAFETLVGQ